MLTGNEKTPAVLTAVANYTTDTTVRFVVEMPEARLREAMAAGLHKYFKLTTTFSLANMVLFDAKVHTTFTVFLQISIIENKGLG